VNIVQFVQRYPPALGGSEAYTARLCRWLASRGHRVHAATTTARDLTAFRDRRASRFAPGITSDAGVTVERHALTYLPAQRYLLAALSLVPIPTWQGWVMPSSPMSWPMLRWADRYDGPCDIVHATAFPYGWPLRCALRLARRRGVPFVLTPFLHLGDLDDPHNRIRRAFTRPALVAIARAADRLLVQTPQEAAALVDLGIAGERVILQGLGVDVAECTGGDREGWRARLGFTPQDVVVGHLANLSQEKGSNDLLIASRGRPWRLVLAGPAMPNFRPEPGAVVLGVLTEAEKRDFFAGIDVFALPSVVDSFGLVLLEAGANGVPCIGYRAGGIPGVIDEVIVPCNPASLAEGLAALVVDEALRRHLGQQGRERAAQANWAASLSRAEGVLCS